MNQAKYKPLTQSEIMQRHLQHLKYQRTMRKSMMLTRDLVRESYFKHLAAGGDEQTINWIKSVEIKDQEIKERLKDLDESEARLINACLAADMEESETDEDEKEMQDAEVQTVDSYIAALRAAEVLVEKLEEERNAGTSSGPMTSTSEKIDHEIAGPSWKLMPTGTGNSRSKKRKCGPLSSKRPTKSEMTMESDVSVEMEIDESLVNTQILNAQSGTGLDQLDQNISPINFDIQAELARVLEERAAPTAVSPREDFAFPDLLRSDALPEIEPIEVQSILNPNEQDSPQVAAKEVKTSDVDVKVTRVEVVATVERPPKRLTKPKAAVPSTSSENKAKVGTGRPRLRRPKFHIFGQRSDERGTNDSGSPRSADVESPKADVTPVITEKVDTTPEPKSVVSGTENDCVPLNTMPAGDEQSPMELSAAPTVDTHEEDIDMPRTKSSLERLELSVEGKCLILRGFVRF